jgi:hypothetical protein
MTLFWFLMVYSKVNRLASDSCGDSTEFSDNGGRE